MSELWRGPLLRLPGGVVLLTGSALADVVRALQTAQHVTRRDGYAPNERWTALLADLRAALEEAGASARAGSAEVPQVAPLPASDVEELVGTAEVARMLGCGTRNVRDLHARGVLDSGRLLGGRLLFERVEVEGLAQDRRSA